jgi:hypothetical protein
MTIPIRFNLRDFENDFFYFTKIDLTNFKNLNRLHELIFGIRANDIKNHTTDS